MTSTGTPTFTPVYKVPFNPGNITAIVAEPRAWCYEYFPEFLMITTYLLTCIVAGVTASGIYYNIKWYNVPFYNNRHREKFQNKVLGKQRNMIAWCVLYFLLSTTVLATGLMYFMSNQLCPYVYVWIAYYICIGGTFAWQCIILPREWWSNRRDRLRELENIRAKVAEQEDILGQNPAFQATAEKPLVIW